MNTNNSASARPRANSPQANAKTGRLDYAPCASYYPTVVIAQLMRTEAGFTASKI